MSWQSRMRQEVYDRDEVIRQLRAKLDVAVTRLADVAAGLHYTDEVTGTWSQETKLKTTAAKGLRKITLMQERRL